MKPEAQQADAESILDELLADRLHPYPYPLYHRLRAVDPLYFSEARRTWYQSGYAPCLDALLTPRIGQGEASRLTRDDPRFEDSSFFRSHVYNMVFRDPPEHTRMRSLVSRAFTPKRVVAVVPFMQALVDGLLAPLEYEPVADLAASFAELIPVAVVCEMLGVPHDDHGLLLEWTHAIAQALRPTVPDAVIKGADRATDHFWEYFRALLKAKQSRPSDDLLSDLIEVREGGDRLSDDELCGLAMQLLRAGSETTISVIAGGLRSLLANPEQADLLRADPNRGPAAAEELLRYESPIQLDFTRVVLADHQLQGVKLAEGDCVVPMLAAANRDPERFEQPDRLRVTRSGMAQLAFGKGLHFCLGAPLARLEIQVALGTTLRRFPDAVLAGPPVLRGGPMVRSVQSLPVASGHGSPGRVRTIFDAGGCASNHLF